MVEQQMGHRKSSLVLSAHFPLVNWCSHPVAKSAYFQNEVQCKEFWCDKWLFNSHVNKAHFTRKFQTWPHLESTTCNNNVFNNKVFIKKHPIKLHMKMNKYEWLLEVKNSLLISWFLLPKSRKERTCIATWCGNQARMSWQFGGQFLCKIGSMAMESMCICGNSHSSCKLEISMVKAKVFNSVSLLSFQKQVCLLSSSYHSYKHWNCV